MNCADNQQSTINNQQSKKMSRKDYNKYAQDVRDRAEELYVEHGCTYEEVAERCDVAVNTVKKWGAEGEWKERQKEVRTALGEIKRNTVLLRKKLIANALQSLNPQDVYAVARLEAATRPKAGEPEWTPAGADMREIATPQDAVDALQEAISLKVNRMLSDPKALSLSALKDMKKGLELIEQMKAMYETEDAAPVKRQLDEDTIRQVREIYGLA